MSEASAAGPIPCPNCWRPILAAARKCKHCKSWLDWSLPADKIAVSGALPHAPSTEDSEAIPVGGYHSAAPQPESHTSLMFSAINVVVLLLGLAAIMGAYALLGGGSVTAAPLLLVLGYAVMIPAAIVL
jgi:hypothetical protein